MKKLSVILVLALLLTFFGACSGEPASTAAPTLPTPAATAAPTAPGTEAPADTIPVLTMEAPETTAAPVPVDESAVHPMLFHVTAENGAEAYLFGTIHVGDARINTALEKLIPYVDSCDALAVEFDLVAYENDYAAQMKAMTQFVLTDGTKASDHMPAETFQKAAALLQEAGLFPKLMESYNLSMWAQLVEQAAMMTRSSLDMEKGMDRALINHCYDKQIEVRDVESAEFQYGLLADFPDELNLLLIEQTLDNLDDYSDGVNELYDAWLEGSYDGLMAVLESDEEDTAELSEEEQALLESYNEKMLNQRNVGMCYRALEWLEAGDKVFFAVGAAHLLDDVGLVALLEAEGCTVEQVDY